MTDTEMEPTTESKPETVSLAEFRISVVETIKKLDDEIRQATEQRAYALGQLDVIDKLTAAPPPPSPPPTQPPIMAEVE